MLKKMIIESLLAFLLKTLSRKGTYPDEVEF